MEWTCKFQWNKQTKPAATKEKSEPQAKKIALRNTKERATLQIRLSEWIKKDTHSKTQED